MDDAAKRAEAFNAEERFGELESENARLRAELARVIAQFRAVLDRDEEIIAEVTRVLAMPPDAQQGFADAQATMRACLDLAETVLTPSPKERAEILRQMRDDAAATGLDKKLDVTPDDVVALRNQQAPRGYEIWDTPSGNMLAHFPRYGEALDFIHDQVEALGTAWVQGIAFFEVNPDGDRELIADHERVLPLVRKAER